MSKSNKKPVKKTSSKSGSKSGSKKSSPSSVKSSKREDDKEDRKEETRDVVETKSSNKKEKISRDGNKDSKDKEEKIVNAKKPKKELVKSTDSKSSDKGKEEADDDASEDKRDDKKDDRNDGGMETDEEQEPEPEVEEKSFLERVKDLIGALQSVDGFEKHEGLIAFGSVIQTTMRKEGEQRENLEEGIKNVFEKFYMENRQGFVDEKMEFLTKDGGVIVFGKSGKAHIPLSEIYSTVINDNPELIDTIEACIYFVMQHVCPDDDLDSILEVCREFEPDKQDMGNTFLNFVGNIVGRVSEKLGNTDSKKMETEDGKIDVNAIGTVVQDLIGDDSIRGSMQDMMQNITSEDFDVNSVFKGLFNMKKEK